MHKDGLLKLYEQMVIIKDHFLIRDHTDLSLFDPYDEPMVKPSHVHKSRSEHKHAVFMLGNTLATAASDDESFSAGCIGKRMEELVDDAENKI